MIACALVFLTLIAWHAAAWLQHRTARTWLQPLLVAMVLVALALRLAHVPLVTYATATRPFARLLSASVVALGVGLYDARASLKPLARTLPLSLAAGAVAGVSSAVLTARWLGASVAVQRSLAPKSVTSSIASAIAARTGGIPELAVVIVVFVGIAGAVVVPPLLRAIGVNSPTATGLALGASAHAVGTARATQLGSVEGATSALALALNGLITALAVPWILRALGV